MFTNKEKADEARREVGYRQFVYSKRIADGRMKKAEAERRIAIMQEIQEDYTKLTESEWAQERLL